MMSRSATWILAICASDRTFEAALVRGRDGRDEAVLWGKCIHCNARLVVPADGRPASGVTVEHIIPRHHGGTDDLRNVALACARCNAGKGRRLDHRPRGDAELEAMIAWLTERRESRWREPEDHATILTRSTLKR